ncbi:zinc finger protein 37 homolog [Drosophila serrata]|uniref:zinc finger protein 37 homolog n=1 Tax=Drosophila serrata TaxID=7274 RepID=UPI000A1D15A8|nr:zinc finger protein 37 homolog [Drosophila serrata]
MYPMLDEDSPVEGDLLPLFQEQWPYYGDMDYMHPFLTEEIPELPLITTYHDDLFNDQTVISDGNRRRTTGGTLQQLEVGNSTVEVQGNGSQSFLNIVYSKTDVAEKTVKEQNTEPDNKPIQESPGYTINHYFCSHCGNGFRTQGGLTSHERACQRQEPVENRQCKECQKIFSSVTQLKRHMGVHSTKEPIRCARCHRKFFDESIYSAHLERHKRQDELKAEGNALSAQQDGKELVVKEFMCLFCKQNFKVAFDVGQVKRRSSCDACLQKYNSNEGVPQRQRRYLTCNRCGRHFVFHGFLQRHELTCDGTLKRVHSRRPGLP